MSLTGPIQSRYREAVHYVKDPVCEAVQYVRQSSIGLCENLQWKGFVEKVGFEPGVKE